MNIGSHYGVSAYQSLSKVSAVRQSGSADTAIGGSADSATSSAVVSDKVSLSAAAQAVLSSASNGATTRTAAQQQVLNGVSNDPDGADKIASGMAHATSQLIYSITDGELRLRSTGQLVTPDMMPSLDRISDDVGQKLRALYDSERSNGADPRDILGKLMDFQNSQASRYSAAIKDA